MILRYRWLTAFALAVIFLTTTSFTPPSFRIALLKYSGGGDWYANPTSLPNLVKFANRNMLTNISEDIATVDVGSPDLMNYPFVHMTGHGNVIFSDQEIQNLRNYLIAGGFLHIDDNYGLDKFVRPQLKRLFPELELIELSFDHPIYHQKYNFSTGLPKIHLHDDKAPQGFGLIYEGRLILFYTLECDLGDGWEDAGVHGDSEATRTKALQMGSNILQYVFTDRK
jgi:hypothetical protein